MARLILASASPRRKEICQRLGLDFEVIPADGEEAADPSLPPEQAVIAIARGKARQVFARYPDRPVLGADTVVTVDGRLLGKPQSRKEAAQMLRALQGRWHRVLTGVWLCRPGGGDGFAGVAEVKFAPMTAEEIAGYIATGEPMDKAGGYAIQGIGMRYVEQIKGDFYTVMGLPGAALWQFLRQYPEWK
ncbi:MAG: Maf family protein [Acutalibacteraceae bacterium]|jgi:septum formation protein